MEWQVVTSIATMYKLLSRNNSRIFVSALNSTFLRFVLTGGLLFLVDFSVVLALVLQLNLHPALAQFIGRSCGSVLGYFLHQWFTFPISEVNTERPLSAGWRRTGYIALTVVAITISPAVLMAFLTIFNGWLALAKVFTDGAMIVLTFFAMKTLFQSSKP